MLSNSRLSNFLVLWTLAFLAGCGGSGGGDDATLPDQYPPVITLIGAPNIDHVQGADYIDQGATATDAVDGPVAVVTMGSVGCDTGTYTLTYTATDAAGNRPRRNAARFSWDKCYQETINFYRELHERKFG